MTMPSVRAGNIIIAAKRFAYSHGYSFLACIQVSKSGHFSAEIQCIDMLFKDPYLEHLLIHVQPLLRLI